MVPFVGLERLLADDLHGVVGPLVNDVRGQAGRCRATGPSRGSRSPSSMRATIGAGRVVARQLDPGAAGERLIVLEVADGLGTSTASVGLALEGLGGRHAGVPSGFAADGHRSRLAVDGHRQHVAGAFVQRRVEDQSGRDQLGLGRGDRAWRQPGVELAAGRGPAGVDLLPCGRQLAGQLFPRLAVGRPCGTTTIGGVSLMLPSIAPCVVLLKNAASE